MGTTATLLQAQEEKEVHVGYWRLLKMNRQEWPWLALGALASACVGTVQPISAVLLSVMTDLLTPDEPPANVLRFAIYFFALGAAQLICGGIQVCGQTSGHCASGPPHHRRLCSCAVCAPLACTDSGTAVCAATTRTQMTWPGSPVAVAGRCLPTAQELQGSTRHACNCDFIGNT